MRGFIKPRFTRLHMPFRAKAERSRHSFHLQAVGLALALLAGVLCLPTKCIPVLFCRTISCRAQYRQLFRGNVGILFVGYDITGRRAFFQPVLYRRAGACLCARTARYFYRMCIRLPVCLYGDEGSIGQSDPFLAPGYPAIRISGFIYRRCTGYFHKPVPAEFSGTGNRSGHQNQPLPADFCCFLSRYAACGNLGRASCRNIRSRFLEIKS